VQDTRWNKQFLAGLRMMNLPTNFKFHISVNHHHDFIGAVREVFPALARRVDPQAVTETTFPPIPLDVLLIHASIMSAGGIGG
jgi:hypothetical protein